MAAPMDVKTVEKDEDFPAEIQDRLNEFDEALTKIETCIQPLLSTPLGEVQEKLSSLDKAKLDLISGYTLNSLFWMYLNVKGVNPKEHRVRQELGSIRQYMNRAKTIQDKELAPKLDAPATNRFLRNALWSAAKKKQAEADAEKEAGEKSTAEGNEAGEAGTHEIDKAKAAKKKLWKAAHSQAKQLSTEVAGETQMDSDSPSGKRKKEHKKDKKHKKKRR